MQVEFVVFFALDAVEWFPSPPSRMPYNSTCFYLYHFGAVVADVVVVAVDAAAVALVDHRNPNVHVHWNNNVDVDMCFRLMDCH